MRFPAPQQIESRDGTLARDSKLQNFMVDPIQPSKVQKRPAMWKSNLFAPAGQGFGTFVFNDIVYVWTDNYIPTSGTIDESLMYRSFTYAGGSTYIVLPDNPYEVGDTVTIDGGSYIVDSVDGNEITVSEIPVLLFSGSSNNSSGKMMPAVWDSNYGLIQLTPVGTQDHTVYAVSAAGIKVGAYFSGSNFYAYYWDLANNPVALSQSGTQARAWGVSNDGNIIVGEDNGSGGPVIWNNGIRSALPTDLAIGGTALGVSSNGNYKCGRQYPSATPSFIVACLWNASNIKTDCALPIGNNKSQAFSINDSGISVGNAIINAANGPSCWWDNDGSLLNTGAVSEILRFITNSGYVAGYVSSGGWTAAYWSPSYVKTNLPKTYTNSYCYWISEDGTIKAGFDGTRACYWDENDVQHFLPAIVANGTVQGGGRL